MESQAEILADYFMSSIMGHQNYVGKHSNRRIRSQFFYENTLQNFFAEIEKFNTKNRDLKKQWNLK